MKTDIEIAQSVDLQPIADVVKKVGIDYDDLELYGKYKAKLSFNKIQELQKNPVGKLILVTAINPTPAGEGKSTITIGLADALNKIGKKTMIAIREPSLGPVMGIKGGAAGGGYAQVLPMEDINLHFTGDMHAITTANNALSALIDNHLHQGNALGIDQRRIIWKRVVDLNDRALRHVTVGLGSPVNGIPREDGFDITVASEIMAILCLATSIEDLKERLANIVIGYRYDRTPVYVRDLEVEGALALILKDAIKPNLVQTIYGTPAFVHGGSFANIAHGCNSVLATTTALHLADYTVTEAGFGADLGAEKFLDIKTPNLPTAPDVVVIVATLRALKMNGGVVKEDLTTENVEAVKAGFANLKRHVGNIRKFGLMSRWNWLVSGQMVLTVDWLLRKLWSKRLKRDLPNTLDSMTTICLSKKKSRKLSRKSIVEQKSILKRKQKLKFLKLSRTAGISCQFVWPRPSTVFQIIQIF